MIRLSISAGLICSLVLIGRLFLPQRPALSATPVPPPDIQSPVINVQLQGGHNYRGSPKVADIRLDSPGLEIAVGTAATNASQGNYPASVALVDSSGTVLWETLSYAWNGAVHTVGSVMGTPAVADLDGDGQLDIVVGMGGHNDPVTRGGILALNGHDGSLKWYVATNSIYDGDAVPDGVYASPSVADFDGDGRLEVVVGGFDQYLWLIDGPTGAVEPGFPISMWDTINSSTAVADLDGDAWPDFVFGGDFTNNGATAYKSDDVPQLPPDGGGMRGMKYKDGQFYLPGWDQCLSSVWACVPAPDNNNLLIPIGQWVDQTIFSSPAIADLDQDGRLEIITGSGYYWNPAATGHWVKIWRADGTLLATLPTNGVTFASPALADLNGDGYLDIVIGDLQMGNTAQNIFSGSITAPSTLYAWSGNPGDDFSPLWPPQTIGMWQEARPNIGLFGSPVIADIEPGRAGPEILVGFNQEIVVFSGQTGEQLTYVQNGPSKPTLATFGFHQNSPAVADINDDGRLEIVAAADFAFPIYSPRTWRQHVVAWHWPGAGDNAAGADLPWPQFRRDPPNHAFYPNPTLEVAPDRFGFAYQYGSGDPDPTASFTIRNRFNAEALNYTLSYSAGLVSLGAPATGLVEPDASLEVPFTVLAASQVTGTYTVDITVAGRSGGRTLSGSPRQVQILLLVADIWSTYLPVILK